MVAEVLINSNVQKLNKTFDYNIPENLESRVKIGSRVIISFGIGKDRSNIDGIVINIKEKSEYKLKNIINLKDEFTLSKEKIEMATRLSRKCFCNTYDVIKLMLPPGTTNSNKERVRKKVENGVFLNKDIDEIEFDIDTKKISNLKHIRVLELIKDNEGLTIPEIMQLADVSRAIINTLIKNGYLIFQNIEIQRSPLLNLKVEKTVALKLTKEQEEVVKTIYEETISKNMHREYLIHGVTGSGKTEVYMQLIQKVIDKGKNALVLVPEISLTPQMVERFASRFGNIIGVLHSKLSLGERYDEWRKIYNNEAKIVIGARSAIFSPIKNLGIIIIDEEHDMSYKSETTPRYNTYEVAKYITNKKKIPLVLGSATPEVTTYYRTQIGKSKLFTLSQRANKSNLPTVEIIDMKEELEKGNKSMFSTRLYEEMKRNLEEKHQTILFLNRRGYSTFVMCRDCGFVAKCRNCNISLTYHSKEDKLKCHYCGYETNSYKICPMCKGKNIRYFGTGTQKVEDEIKKIFPNASTIRMDIDTVTKKDSHEKILSKFKNENIDILIGTQMVVKGHHFPNVTLVGAIAADSLLNIEDYRAEERTFQTLTQVAGRAGREHLEGKVIFQTYNPDSYGIVYSQKQDYLKLYNAEINIRNQLNYPPFCDIILIGISSNNEKDTIEKSQKLYDILKNNLNKSINIYSPVPAPIDKIKNNYRWRIIIKTNMSNNIIENINKSLIELGENNKTKIIVDINPSTMN